MEQRISFITLGVKNLPTMKKFYEESFAWKALTANNDIAFFKLNGLILGLFSSEALADDAGVPPAMGKGFRGFTLAQNYTSKKEVDAVFENLKTKGVKTTKLPNDTPWGGYSGYVEDVEGNLWEIAYNPFLEMDHNGNVLTHQSLDSL